LTKPIHYGVRIFLVNTDKLTLYRHEQTSRASGIPILGRLSESRKSYNFFKLLNNMGVF
jgi:hypothetical protein